MRYNISMLFILAVLPLLTLLFFVIALKQSALFSGITSLILLLVELFLAWGITPARAVASSTKGLLVATEITLIIFGALCIFEILKHLNLFDVVRRISFEISRDLRVQVVLITLCIVAFFEGAAGFGTPALVAVPLLMSLGVGPLLAVSLVLLGDTVPVIFGAIGLPVTYGIASPLAGTLSSQMLASLTIKIAGLNILATIFIALAIAFVFVRSRRGTFSHFFAIIPFALCTSLVVSFSALLVAYFVGPELASLVGGACGLTVMIIFAKHSVLTPKSCPAEFLIADQGIDAGEMIVTTSSRSVLKALSPYIILVALLLLTRLPFLPFKSVLESLGTISIPSILNASIQYSFAPFYSLAVIVLVALAISVIVLNIAHEAFLSITKETIKRLVKPFLTLTVLLVFVQLLIYSGDNLSGFSSIPIVIAEGLGSKLGAVWPLVAPFVGALGAFVAGSATVSNLLFSELQYNTALVAGWGVIGVLALQGMGAAFGNAIALHNVVAGLAVAEESGNESVVIRKNITVVVIYLVLLGLLGMFIASVA